MLFIFTLKSFPRIKAASPSLKYFKSSLKMKLFLVSFKIIRKFNVGVVKLTIRPTLFAFMYPQMAISKLKLSEWEANLEKKWNKKTINQAIKWGSDEKKNLSLVNRLTMHISKTYAQNTKKKIQL